MGGGLTGLYHCRYTNYRSASRLYHVLFATETGRSAEQLLAADLLYCWLYPSKQDVDRFVLFARLDRVLFPEMVSRATSDGGSLCPCCWRWQIIDHEEYE